jgi:hypothetical protein
VLVVATFAVALVAAGGLFAAAFVGQVVKVLGDVRINRDGADMPAGMGTALQLGDVVTTGPGARLRLRFIDGSILTLGEKSRMSIDIFSIDATNNSRTVVLSMLEGIVSAAAAKSGENNFDYQIKTANAYTAVRGTKWIVSSLAGATAVYVLNGQVELGAASGQPALVNAGSWASVDAQGRLSPVTPTTPEILKPVLDATSDSGGEAVPPSGTTPTPMPTLPQLQFPTNPRPKPSYPRQNQGGNGSRGGGYGGGMKTH